VSAPTGAVCAVGVAVAATAVLDVSMCTDGERAGDVADLSLLDGEGHLSVVRDEVKVVEVVRRT
jgi:hypothetical protein